MTYRTPAVLKTFFEDGDVPTESQFGDLIDSTHSGTINILSFGTGIVGDGTTDDSAAFQSAFNSAADGSVIVIPPASYVIASNVSIADKSLTIYGYGATLIQGADVTVLTCSAAFATPLTVSAIDNTATRDYSSGGGVSTPVARITVVGTPPSVGDIIKVVSDDFLEGVDAGENERQGEFAKVGAVDGQDVYTYNRLIETYTTSPRIAVMGSEHRVEVRGLKFDTQTAGDAGGWSSGYLILQGLYKPVAEDISCPKGFGQLIGANGCLEARGTRISATDLRNEPSNSRFGYVVNDVSSQHSSWSQISSDNCRHAYTTNVNPTTAGDSQIELFGRTIGSVVANSVSFNSSNVGFDTHSDAYAITFDNCTAFGDYRGESSTGAGFGARGKMVSFNDCFAINCRFGFLVFHQYDNGTRDIRINSCRTVGDGSALITSTSGAGTDPEIRVSDCDFESANATAIDVDNCYLLLENTTIRPRGSSVNRALDAGANAFVEAYDLTIDLTHASGSGYDIVRTSDATADVRVNGARVRNNAAIVTSLVDFNSVNATAIFRKVDMDAAPTSSAGYVNNGASSTIGIDYVVGGALTSSRAYVVINRTTTGAFSLDFDFRSAEFILFRIQVSSTDVNLNDVPDGLFIGQRIQITCRDNSSDNLIITSTGAGNLTLGRNVILAPGQTLFLTWNGSTWLGGDVVGVIDQPSSDRGDANVTLDDADSGTQIFDTALTGTRTISVPTATGSRRSTKYRIVRTANATGAFNLNISDGATVKSLTAAGQWADVVCTGSDWILVAAGTL